MPESDRDWEPAVRQRAYLNWESEGRPDGRAKDHLRRATIESVGDDWIRADEPMDDEEKILAGWSDANVPALLTKDVQGGLRSGARFCPHRKPRSPDR
jgi:hypothetical protein